MEEMRKAQDSQLGIGPQTKNPFLQTLWFDPWRIHSRYNDIRNTE
jgi:hypothetical protein